MRILILGGDGYLGWPTALHLSQRGHDVAVVDNFMRRAWDRVRIPGAAGTPWRFAVGATLPLLVLLSVAATARDIYAAPVLLGFGLLIALWAVDARSAPTRLDETAIRWTRLLVACIACMFAAVAE